MGMRRNKFRCLFLLVCCLRWSVVETSSVSSEYFKKENKANQQTNTETFLSDHQTRQSTISVENPERRKQISYATTGYTPESMNFIKNKQDESLSNKFERIRHNFQDIIAFLRTDGHPEKPPSAGISWFAIFTAFILLSPMLIPMILSPLLLVVGFFLFLPTIIENYQNEAD